MSTAEILDAAVAAKGALSRFSPADFDVALSLIADRLEENADAILEANRLDVEESKAALSPVMIDRLTLTRDRIAGMANGIREIASLPSPLGKILQTTDTKEGLHIEKVAVPMGVVAAIYESRPNVTADIAALSLKSGNAVVLRGGREAYRSSLAVVRVIRAALRDTGLPENAVSLLDDLTRESAKALMTARGKVDLLIPRGGAGLIRSCVENATVPCIETGTGICHVYIDRDADVDKALAIVDNAKTSRPSVCNAAEVCLVHEAVAPVFLPLLKERLQSARAALGLTPVSFRADRRALPYLGGTPAGDGDFDTEFLDYVLAVKVVSSPEEAIAHIAAHSTHHSDAVVTENGQTAALFLQSVDSAAVYHNASTRFTDGGVFGLGCEIGISTQKLHARGPMGVDALTTYKFVVHGNGQIRK